MTNKQAIKVLNGMEYMPLNRKSEDVQSASTLAINALMRVDELKAENATLKKALEMMYQDNKGYNHDGTGNPEYYMQKARETDGQ